MPANWTDCTKIRQHWTLTCTGVQLATLTSRYQLCDHHGGCTFCIWLLALSSLAREKVSELPSFLAGLLLKSHAQTDINAHMHTKRLFNLMCGAVYIISPLYLTMTCKVCPFTALFTTHTTHAGMY